MKRNNILSDILDTVRDACFENSDGCARSRRTLLTTGWIMSLVNAVTLGTFFSVLMLAIGADDIYIGYVTMITTLCGLAQIFAPLVWERIPRRKPYIVAYNYGSAFLTYGVVTLIPFLPIGNSGKLGLYLAVTVINGLFTAFTSPASNSYTMQSIPLVKRVNFTSVSTLISTVINILSTFLAGVFLDACEAQSFSFASLSPALSAILILRAGAFLLTMLTSTLSALFVPEFPYAEEEKQSAGSSLSLLIKPLKNKPFLMSIMIPCIWAFIGQIIGNFFTLHLIENVKMSYTRISSANMISTPLVLLLTPVWTLILKKHSWVRTLAVALAGYCTAYLCNVFISADTQYFYFLAIIVGNLFNPCINMVNTNLIYLKFPEQDRTAFFSFYSIATMLCSFLGQTVGTLFVKWTPELRFSWFGVPVCNLQFTSLIAALLGFALAVYTWYFSKVLDKPGFKA